jgi:hypothetical protein
MHQFSRKVTPEEYFKYLEENDDSDEQHISSYQISKFDSSVLCDKGSFQEFERYFILDKEWYERALNSAIEKKDDNFISYVLVKGICIDNFDYLLTYMYSKCNIINEIPKLLDAILNNTDKLHLFKIMLSNESVKNKSTLLSINLPKDGYASDDINALHAMYYSCIMQIKHIRHRKIHHLSIHHTKK